MRVRDVLASKASGEIFTVRPEATLIDLLDALAEHNVGALVVSDDGSAMLGIVSERDVVRRIRSVDDLSTTSVADIMTSDVHVASPDDSFGTLMARMTQHRVRHVPVVEDGELLGVVSIGDAVKHRMDQLEFERDQLNQYVAGG